MTPSTGAVPSGTPVRVQSDGLVVLLFDHSREKAIRRSQAEILYGVGTRTFRDSATAELLSTGTLLVYGLQGDGEIEATVIAGGALDDATAASDEGWLDLPSGALCIHSYDSLPMGDNGTRSPVKGARVEVAPGRYRVRIVRRGESPDTILLSPLGDGEPAPVAPNVLFGDCIGYEPPRAVDTGTVADGTWRGRIVLAATDESRAITLNFGTAQAAALGLAWGDRVEIEAGGAHLVAFYQGTIAARAAFHQAQDEEGKRWLAAQAPAQAVIAYPRSGEGDGLTEWLHVIAGEGDVPPLLRLPVGTTVSLRRADASFARAPQPGARLKKGDLLSEVLYSREGMMMVGIDYPTFRKLKAQHGEFLELRVGDRRLAAVNEFPVDVLRRRQDRTGEEDVVETPLFELDFARYWGGTGEGTCMRVRPAVHPLYGPVYRGPGAELPAVPVGTPVVLGRASAD
jgi:hypothetical protein